MKFLCFWGSNWVMPVYLVCMEPEPLAFYFWFEHPHILYAVNTLLNISLLKLSGTHGRAYTFCLCLVVFYILGKGRIYEKTPVHYSLNFCLWKTFTKLMKLLSFKGGALGARLKNKHGNAKVG